MMIATRRCAACGAPFDWSSRNPNRRFCSTRCKTRSWRARDAGELPAAATVPFAPGRAADEPLPSAAPGLGTTSSCPNCHEPITVINMVVPLDPQA